MTITAKIKEIFESIQGEGILIGVKQLFIRFACCNLKCAYCDTDCSVGENTMELSEEELFDKIRKTDSDSISLTGGEPLLHVDFIKSFLTKYKKFLNKDVYLETNGILYEELAQIIDLTDLVAMDIKIQSATGQENRFEENEKFLQIAKDKAFVKVVFTKDIQDFEIEKIISIVEKYNAPLILQPKTPSDGAPYLEIYDKFYSKYKDTRLIAQEHKVLNIA